MSEKEKSAESSSSPATPGETAPGAAAPPAETVTAQPGGAESSVAKPKSADQATTPSPVETPALQTAVTAPDEQEFQIWNEQVRRRIRLRTRRSFLGLGAGLLAGTGAAAWLMTRKGIGEEPWPLRRVLEANERLARRYFSAKRLSPEFSRDRLSEDRVNGDLGLDDDIDVARWKLQVQGLAAQSAPLALGLGAIRKLPRVEMTTEFKCIEGWSVIVQWAGARFTDFMKAFPPKTLSGATFSLDRAEDLPSYVSMETPNGGYYVGLDMESMLHPQTLLCYEQNGEPLTQEHGAPLRLVIPVKYGVKNIKRIGTIRYATARPADYWAEQGYDWYIGL